MKKTNSNSRDYRSIIRVIVKSSWDDFNKKEYSGMILCIILKYGIKILTYDVKTTAGYYRLLILDSIL